MIVTLPLSGERHLIAAASRALRAAGWTSDQRVPAFWRAARLQPTPDGDMIAWEQVDGTWYVGVWRTIAGRVEHTEVAVASVQQAIDFVAALTGVGVELTTGARGGAR